MFVGANLGGSDKSVPEHKSTHKILAGTTYSYPVQPGKVNQEHLIFGASHLLEVGDLSLCNSTEYLLGTATNLKTIKIGDENHPPQVTTKLELSAGKPYSNLKLLDLTNVKFSNIATLNLKLANGANLTPSLQTLKLKGSSLEYLVLGEYTPVTFISLPDKIKNINMINQLVLKDLEIYGTDYVENITLQNCPLLDQISILNRFVNTLTVTILADNLQCDEDHAVNETFMKWLMDINANLSGNIFVESISDSNLDIYREK